MLLLLHQHFYIHCYILAISVYGIQGVPRSIGVIQPIILFVSIISSRLVIKYLATKSYNFRNKIVNKKKILIYGAGDAGRQLIIALENSPEYKVVGFLDDNIQLHKQVLLGKSIYSPNKLEKLIQTKE